MIEKLEAPEADGRIRVAIGSYDRTRPLLEGRVTTAGFQFLSADTETATVGMLNGRFDAGEMSLATYVKAREEGAPLIALPLFTHRKFFHQYVFVRRGGPIRCLTELRGRRVLVPMYWMTSSIWHREILAEESGIQASEIEWLVARRDRLEAMQPPPNVHVREVGGTLDDLVDRLRHGEADCLMTAATTPAVLAARAELAWPYGDACRAQREFFARTRVFPPVHAIVCRRDLVEGEPERVARLAAAVGEAKRVAYAELEDESRTSLPFVREYLEDTRATFGLDPYTDGIEPNRGALEMFLNACFRQRLTARSLSVEEAFLSDRGFAAGRAS